jgi:oligopeptide/dipeptide ABC transporter ATP-binding protein
MAPPILSLDALSIHIRADDGRRLKIVDDITFDIAPGQFFALVGESGSGKTMIARAIMRLLPDALVELTGAIRFSGEELTRAPEARLRQLRNAHIGMIFQEPMSSLDPLMPIGRQIAEAIDAHGRLRESEKRQRILDSLAEVQFRDPELVMRQFPHELSGGMRQRVVIAMALVNGPSLLIADEPTTALDVTIQSQILDLIAELARVRGLAVLLITHDLSLVRQYADEIGVLYGGVMMERGCSRDVIERPVHPYTAALLACVPRRRSVGTRQDGIDGSVPSVAEWRPGCRFVERCHHATAACGREPIAWRALGHRGVRCIAPLVCET